MGGHSRTGNGQAGTAGDGDTAVAEARAVHRVEDAGERVAIVRSAWEREDVVGESGSYRVPGEGKGC